MLIDTLFGKATMDVHRMSKQGHPLRTLAIGASTYGSIKMGMNCQPAHTIADYFRLRIYHIDHAWRLQGSVSPNVQLIAKGTPADAQGLVDHLEIFDTYWLDGAHQKPRPAENQS